MAIPIPDDVRELPQAPPTSTSTPRADGAPRTWVVWAGTRGRPHPALPVRPGRTGADVVAAIALGARFTMVGRAYLYGLMARGRAGVDRMIAIMRGDIERTMRLLGATRLDELAPRHVTLPGR